jgi:hypothetical protein
VCVNIIYEKAQRTKINKQIQELVLRKYSRVVLDKEKNEKTQISEEQHIKEIFKK